jgi:hypothetical protein
VDQPPGQTTTVERLARDLFDGSTEDPFSAELTTWLAASRRFRAFAEAHRDKIRKKLRGATDAEARRDVRAELQVAHLLLADRRIELAFERHGSGKRGPDFTVFFRGERSFDLEVTRLRNEPAAASLVGPLLTKLRQLPPSVPNALLVAIEGASAQALDVATATATLRATADARDDAFFAARGFETSRAFYQIYLRLGGVFVWCEAAGGEARGAVWINRSARIPLPDRAVRACLARLRESSGS